MTKENPKSVFGDMVEDPSDEDDAVTKVFDTESERDAWMAEHAQPQDSERKEG